MADFDQLTEKDGTLYYADGVEFAEAGPRGYIQGKLRGNGKKFYAHRIIWEKHNGPIPTGMQIDHIDGNRANNRIENLRLVTNGQNKMNSRIAKNNTSGHKNVTRKKNKWQVRVMKNGKLYSKLFDTLEEAATAARNLRERLHQEYTNHG